MNRINQVIFDRAESKTYVYRAGSPRPEVYDFNRTPGEVLIWALDHDFVPVNKDKTIVRSWRGTIFGTEGVHGC